MGKYFTTLEKIKLNFLKQNSCYNPGNGKTLSECPNAETRMDVIANPKDFSDVKILLEDGSKFDASKFMLATHSPFFAKLFTHRNVQEYHVDNVTRQSFKHIIDWIYKVNR